MGRGKHGKARKPEKRADPGTAPGDVDAISPPQSDARFFISRCVSTAFCWMLAFFTIVGGYGGAGWEKAVSASHDVIALISHTTITAEDLLVQRHRAAEGNSSRTVGSTQIGTHRRDGGGSVMQPDAGSIMQPNEPATSGYPAMNGTAGNGALNGTAGLPNGTSGYLTGTVGV